MIKLSILSLSYQRAFRSGQMDLFSFLDTCRALDADGVDFNARQFPDDSDSFVKEVKERCVRRGLAIACLSISNNFGKSAEQLPDEIAMTRHWIDRALLLGAPQVRVFAGTPNPNEPRQATWERCSRALKEVADYGYERGVLVSLQNHNHGALTEYGDDVLNFVDEAGPHLSHVWDTGQYVGSPGASGANPEAAAQEVLYQSLQQTVHLATHVRCKFYRIDSGVEQWLDYPRDIAMLKAAGYNGFCSVVSEGKGDEIADVAKAVAYLRPMLRP
ncbi:MAG TPA: sugar phosphate isomerase/epimerase [Chloroflexota bacterium]|nr:sugar phosphate isomerase/epimerase [Chloroflexota bacterium]